MKIVKKFFLARILSLLHSSNTLFSFSKYLIQAIFLISLLYSPTVFLDSAPTQLDPYPWIEVTVKVLFQENFKPSEKGYLVIGVYADTETYNLITSLDLEDIHPQNLQITEKMWDNYFRLVISHPNKTPLEQKLVLYSQKNYAITTFYDRNNNWEFDLFSYPRENYGFSNYRKKITWRKPYFDEISFSPKDFREKPMIIKMKP